MNQVTKKVLTLLLVGAIASSISCGGSGASTDTTSANSDESTSAANTTSEYKNPGVDYKGADFEILILTDWGTNYRIGNYDLLSEEIDGEIINDAVVATNRAVEEALNVNLKHSGVKYVTPNKVEPIMTSVLAGDDEFKVAMVMSCGLPTLLGQPDMLVDLASIDTLDLSKSWWQQNSVDEYKLFGKQYAASGDIGIKTKGSAVCYFFNKQVAEDLNLGNLYQLVYDGDWTVDKLIELSSAAYGDLNGNTEVDLEDRFGLFCESGSLYYALNGAGIKLATKTDDTVSLSVNSSRTVDMVEKLVPMYHTDGTTMFQLDIANQFKSVFSEFFRPAFIENRVLFYTNQLLNALDFRVMEGDFGILPAPKYDKAQEDYHNGMSSWWCENAVVPATNSELEMTGHVLDALGFYSKKNVTPAFIDETVIGKSIRDDDSAYMVQLLLDTQLYDLGLIFDWGGMFTMVSNLAGQNSTGFASAYAAAEPGALAALEKTVEQLGG